jgi:threonine synthase
VNPYRLEGQKTPAFEIAEAFDWNVPDHLIVPGGNLGNSFGAGQGLSRDARAGTGGADAEDLCDSGGGANPLVRSFRPSMGRNLEPVEADTRATAIRIGNPASWRKAARLFRRPAAGAWM